MAVRRDPRSILITPEEAASLLRVGRSKVFEFDRIGGPGEHQDRPVPAYRAGEITAYIARQRDPVRQADEEYGEERAAS
jgi:hypothetical protein